MRDDTKQFLGCFVPFILALAACAGIIVWCLRTSPVVNQKPPVVNQIDSQATSVKLGGKAEATAISPELQTKIDSFKVQVAVKNKTEAELSADKLAAIDLYNQVSKETGAPPVIKMGPGVSFETALLNSFNN